MSRKKKIFLWILIVLIVALLAAAWAYRDLINVVFTGITETPEQIAQKKEELDNKQKEALKQAGVENVRPLDEYEKEELDKGNITRDEAIDIITGKTTIDEIKQNKESNTSSQTQKPEEKNEAQAPKPADNSVNEKIAKMIGEIYVLEANFTSQIKSLEGWAVSEYNQTPKEEKAAKKKELAAIGFPKLSALEKECDAKVNAILSELQTVLKESGQSTELVNQIRDAYDEKKIATKSHYISEYM